MSTDPARRGICTLRERPAGRRGSRRHDSARSSTQSWSNSSRSRNGPRSFDDKHARDHLLAAACASTQPSADYHRAAPIRPKRESAGRLTAARAKGSSRLLGPVLRRRQRRQPACRRGLERKCELDCGAVARSFVGRAAAQRPARRDAAAEAAGAAGLLLGPAVVGRVRDRADRAGARPRRAGAAAPDAVAGGGGRACCWSSSSRPTARPATPTRTAAAPTPSAARTSARTPRWSRRRALLIDYVLTVAVSVVAGVAAITSAVPALAAARRRALARLRRAAHRREPARRQGVGPGLRRSRPTASCWRSSRCSSSAFAEGRVRRRASRPRARSYERHAGHRDRRAAHRRSWCCARSRRAAPR